MASSADVNDPAAKAALACFDSKDWVCAFNGLSDFLETSERLETCDASERGCGYEISTPYTSAIGAAENATVPERRQIAERALNLLGQVSNGVINTNGEVLFSALRYDACRAQGDEVCMVESAALIQLATHAGNTQADFAIPLLADQGISYPIDLDAVVAEVSQTEKTP